jgi:hypothetical protein
MAVIVPHPAEIAALKHEGWFRDHIERIGGVVAAIAQDTAPRTVVHRPPPPGHGADSIHCEMVESIDGWHAHVGWDRAHFYMGSTNSHAIQEAAAAVVGR